MRSAADMKGMTLTNIEYLDSLAEENGQSLSEDLETKPAASNFLIMGKTMIGLWKQVACACR